MFNANIKVKGKESVVKTIKWPMYLVYPFSKELLLNLHCKPFLYLNRPAGILVNVPNSCKADYVVHLCF